MKINIAIFTTCALMLVQADLASADYSIDTKAETFPKIAIQNSAEPSIELAQNATLNSSGVTVAAESNVKPVASPDIPKLTNGIGGQGGGRFTFKPTISLKQAKVTVNIGSSNRDHIDQDAQADLKK